MLVHIHFKHTHTYKYIKIHKLASDETTTLVTYPATKQWGVPPVSQHTQDGVRCSAHSRPQWGAPLSNDRAETVGMRLSKHRRRATKARQIKQHPKTVIITVDLQTARVENLTVGFEKRQFHLLTTACKSVIIKTTKVTTESQQYCLINRLVDSKNGRNNLTEDKTSHFNVQCPQYLCHTIL